MPIYEYFCPKCRKAFELMRPFSQSDAPAPCPACGTIGEKLVSVFASKCDFYIKPPAREAFRQPPVSQTSSKPSAQESSAGPVAKKASRKRAGRGRA